MQCDISSLPECSSAKKLMFKELASLRRLLFIKRYITTLLPISLSFSVQADLSRAGLNN